MSDEKLDYYEILNLDRDATESQIKKAYRKLAMTYHPDKNPDNKEEALKKFQEIGEAYDVLINEEKRALYDKYGHEGLSEDFNDNTTSNQSSNAFEIFNKFFSDSNPFASFEFDAKPFDTKLTRTKPPKGKNIYLDLEVTLQGNKI